MPKKLSAQANYQDLSRPDKYTLVARRLKKFEKIIPYGLYEIKKVAAFDVFYIYDWKGQCIAFRTSLDAAQSFIENLPISYKKVKVKRRKNYEKN